MKHREFWIDISDCIDDEDALPVAFLEHPQQGPLVWQSMLIHVVEAAALQAAEDRIAGLMSSLKYCFESMCKHEGETLRQGFNRDWCYDCSSWVYESDFNEIKKIREALKGEGK